MTTPAAIIARLDASLARAGTPVDIRRKATPTDIALPSRASLRPAKADDLVGGIKQGSQIAVISPTGLGAIMPLRKDDKLILSSGKVLNIDDPRPIEVQAVIVRFNAIVSG